MPYRMEYNTIYSFKVQSKTAERVNFRWLRATPCLSPNHLEIDRVENFEDEYGKHWL